ncbi:MAG TPA: restriction endonuclease subunit M [Candidatus Cloacimonas sp.]|nr:restriction endonuclease subunit M [Candidatus Cloacimonas sp.]
MAITHSEIVSFIWGIADLIRDTFKRGKYQDVILPLTVLRRLDCVLEATKQKVLETNAQYKDKLENPDLLLRKASGYAFYNTSLYDFERLLADAPNLAANLRNYINGFSPNMREVLEKFDFDNTITKLDESGLLFKVMEQFKNINLHPDVIDNPTMGTIFEELIRKFNEALNENPGEHFTPRDVVRLMVSLLLAGDEERFTQKGSTLTVYDPCCGTGGMLIIAKEHIFGTPGQAGNNSVAQVFLFGQEVNPETYAVCKSDLFIKDPSGHDADNIAFGSTLSNDGHSSRSFDYIIANPPYGKDWRRDEDHVRAEHERGASGRFGAGLPRISDGQLLFLQHMLSRMRSPEEGGSRVAIIMNGSPLFTGDAGSGESEIRRWILENDWLEALIALPEQLFYNTGISTYIWIITNKKEAHRQGKIQLIDARQFYHKMRKSLGNKRHIIGDGEDGRFDHISLITRVHSDFIHNQKLEFESNGETQTAIVSKIFDNADFGYQKITVQRPLRLNFQTSAERIDRLDSITGFANLARSKKKNQQEKQKEIEAGEELQQKIRAVLQSMDESIVYRDREQFVKALKQAFAQHQVSLKAPQRKAILEALGERDETAAICKDSKGNPEADPELRDTENVPLKEDIDTYFQREVLPHLPDAWIDHSKTRIGYEIPLNRHFYVYQPPRPLEEIEADLKALEQEIAELMGEIK